jgi:hypothetical protein
VRSQNQAFYEFMVPLVKGYSTEMSLEVTSLGVQVHGGMGFIEETGAAQYYRDAKILTIYEGTTAIQANDLVGRKTARDGGQTAKAIAARSRRPKPRCAPAAAPTPRPWPSACRPRARPCAGGGLHRRPGQGRPNAVFAGSVPYLMLAGNLVAGWQMGRALLAAEDSCPGRGRPSCRPRSPRRFYAEHILTKAPGLPTPCEGADRDGAAAERSDEAIASWALVAGQPILNLRRHRMSSFPGAAKTGAAGHRLAAVHHQQPQAGDRAVQGRHRRLHAGAQRPPGRAAGRLAGRDHRDAGRLGQGPSRQPAAPFAINQIVHKSNDRLEHDMQVCAKYKVPIVITSLGAREDVNQAVHGWGGVVLHDIINNKFARKAIEKGADGLIAVAAGAGGHAG